MYMFQKLSTYSTKKILIVSNIVNKLLSAYR